MNFGTANGDNHYDGDGYKLYLAWPAFKMTITALTS